MRASLTLLVLSACDPSWDIPDDSGGMSSLADVMDHSVNRASAALADDEGGLRLYTEPGDNEVGGFHGSGTGNKAIGGLPGFDGMALGDLSGLVVETTLVTGGWTPYFNLILDLDCACETYKVIVADASLVASPSSTDDGASRYEYAADAAQWKAVGGLDDLLPAHLASEGGTLTSVAAAYPDACLRDADTGDNGLPAGEVTSAVLIILGDSLNDDESEHRVSALEVGEERYASP